MTRPILKLLYAACITGVALFVTGCPRGETQVEPPRRTLLACAHDGAPDSPIILILDTGSKEVVWANEKSTPRGTLATTEFLYTIEFRSRSGALVSVSRINRFDGRMDREVGQAPFFAHGGTRPGNHLQKLLCEQQQWNQKI